MSKCIVEGCVPIIDSSVSFHSFPRSKNVLAKWLEFVRKPVSELPKSARVCSRHFQASDFEKNPELLKSLGASCGKLNRLRKDSVPTLRTLTAERRKEKRSGHCESPASSSKKRRSSSDVAQHDPEFVGRTEDETCSTVSKETADFNQGSSDVMSSQMNVTSTVSTVSLGVNTDEEPHIPDDSGFEPDIPVYNCLSIEVPTLRKIGQTSADVPNISPTQIVHVYTKQTTADNDNTDGKVCGSNTERKEMYSVQCQVPYNLVKRKHVAVQESPEICTRETQTEQLPFLPNETLLSERDSTFNSVSDSVSANKSKDDPDWNPDSSFISEIGEETYEELQDEVSERKFIVFESQLDKLFENCNLCGSGQLVTKKINGTLLKVESVCDICNESREWYSQPLSGTMALGNLILGAAILFAGLSPVKALNLLTFSGIATFCDRTFRNYQRLYYVPSVMSIWTLHQARQNEEIKQAGEPVRLGGDARCDSPGHTAKYGSYSLMDLERNKILDCQLVQSNEVKNSYWMEMEGLKRCLEYLKEAGLKISHLVTDRHVQVKKFMREEEPTITHWFDVWHVAKGIFKKLEAVGKKKGCEKVRAWARSISNHLYWCAASSDGDGELVTQKWMSILNHIRNVHEGHGDRFESCLHEPLEDRLWMKKGFKPYEETAKIVGNKLLLKDIGKLSPAQQTSSLEAFHKVVCHFAPKFVHYEHPQMEARLCLAALHFNENANRAQATRKDGTPQYSVSYQRGREGGVAKEVKVTMTYESGLKRSARLRSRKNESESQNEQGAIGMSLDVLAHVASETLKKEPNSARKNEKTSLKRFSLRNIGSVEVLSLDQILGLTEKTVLNLFTESSANELARTFTFTCQLIPKKCQKQFTSFGSEMRARTEMKKHVYEHLSKLEKDPESRNKFTAEPVHIRNKRLLSYNTAKKPPAKKTKLPAPKLDLIRTKIIADSVYISDPCLQRKKKLVGFIPDPDKLESMAVSKDIFQEDFNSADTKSTDECERKIEENEQFIIELLSKTQPHHDHGYTTIFGKRKNPEHVDQLLGKVDNEPDFPDTSWKDDLNLQGMKKVVFIELADPKQSKKKPAPILFLRHRSPDENVPMVSAEEIIEEKTDGEEEDDEYEMSTDEDAPQSAPLSSGEKPYPPMPKSLLARKGRLGFDIQDLSPEASDDEDFIKTRKKTNPLGREGREGNLGWEPKLALKFIKELKGRKRDENIPLRCKICNSKTFTATATLMYHYRSHAGIKPFVCLICNTTFTRQHSLNYHMLIHNNQSRFTCKDCGRKFRHPSHFKEHLRRHTGETPFECADCGQKFKTRNTYKRHLKTRHGKLLTATGIHLLTQEEFAKVRTKRYHIPRLLPDIGYKMPELTFTKLKRKQTGELEKVEEEKLTRSEIVDDHMIFEELKADIKKEAESGNESDPELVDILEVLSQTAKGDSSKEIQVEKEIKQEPLSDSDKSSKPCTTVIYVNNVGGNISHTAGLVNIK